MQNKYERLKICQNRVFIIAHKLTGRLGNNGISQSQLWNYVRAKYDVKSRYEMTEEKWIKLGMELADANNFPKLLDELCERIQTEV